MVTFAAGKPIEVTHVRITDAGGGRCRDGSRRRRARPLGKKRAAQERSQV
jgi:hypothetical protein